MWCYRGHLCRDAPRVRRNSDVEHLPEAIHQMNTKARSTAGTAAALIGAVVGSAIVLATCADAGAQGADPARVTFASMDGRTKLVGYVFTPGKAGRASAVVMMHGRAGPYSTEANGRYDASLCRSVIRCGGICGHRWAMWRSWSTALDRAAIRKVLRAAATISVRDR